MSRIGDNERITQNELVEFFKSKDYLDYDYLGDLSDIENKNIKPELLLAFLKKNYSDKVSRAAVLEFEKVCGDMTKGLYGANMAVYSLLKYGVKVDDGTGSIVTVNLIDWTHPEKNDFSIAEEVTIKARIREKRPDIVVYVNGIALAVIELKKSSVSVSHGIRQNLTNQREHFIESFFTTVQIVAAANGAEGVRYGVIRTPETHFLEWQNDDTSTNKLSKKIAEKIKKLPNKVEWQTYSIFQKERFLDIVHNFIVFDGGIKKIARYNQYFGVLEAQQKVQKREGGIIWHTQGSGKSLTMAWLAKWILWTNPKARVLVVTDREELDDQIERTFGDIGEKIWRTKSGADLIEVLDKEDRRLICSLVHKFGKRTDSRKGEKPTDDYEKYLEELKKALPRDFKAKGEIFVFVDECHRTQSGKLHLAMKKGIIPDGVFIGFTGTPLLKRDKDKVNKLSTFSVFGGYIHTYKYDQAVRDKVVLDLRYEARDVEQWVSNGDRIDTWFEAKTVGLTPRAAAKLKQMWGNLEKLYSSRERLEKVAIDIIADFNLKPRLAEGNGNAILVAEDIYAACKYYEIFLSHGFEKCAIITSFEPQAGRLRTETTSADEDTAEWSKYKTYMKMLGFEGVDEPKNLSEVQARFEKEAKRKFVDEPAQMKLLIVVDKLLTGFDAPPCTYLYIDKRMQDHGLFQAICRVNRLDGVDKDFGFVVDYKELFGKLNAAVSDYTAEDNPFAEYDKEDIEDLLKVNADETKKLFESILDELETLCEGVKPPKKQLEYIRYFCGASGVDASVDETFSRIRESLYKLTGKLTRAFAEFKGRMTEVGYTTQQQNNAEFKVRFYLELRETIGNASGDFIDFKRYEPGMRFLIDNYISADSSQKIGCFEEFTLLDFIVLNKDNIESADQNTKESAAEAIENNIRKKIIEKRVVNPYYYEKLSEILERLIEERKNGTIAYKDLLAKYIEQANNVVHPEQNSAHYPKGVTDSKAKMMFFDNFGHNETRAVALYDAVIDSKQDGFRGDLIKTRKIRRALNKILSTETEVDAAIELICAQEEF